MKWKRLIAFEKRNTHGLDPEKLRARIRFVFRQCLDCLRFYPEIWCVLCCVGVLLPGEGHHVLARDVAWLP